MVKLAVSEGGVAVTAQSDQMGGSRRQLEAEVEGDEVTIAFNARYLLDYLGVVREEKNYFGDGGEKAVGFSNREERLPACDYAGKDSELSGGN